MTYQAWRKEFVARMAREYPGEALLAVVDKCRRVIRDSNRIQSHAVNLCNREVTDMEEMRAHRAQARIVAEFPKGTRFEFWGDPRGACAKVELPSDKVRGFGDFTAIPSR